MKKIVLSIAGVMAAVAFAPEASAIPSFARQTGMACSACHAQHFPVLNGFGQSFKAAGYTMMGAQGKVEGEHLSIPDTLNASMLFKARYQKTNGFDAAGGTSGLSPNSGQWQIPDEFSLFLGGRVAENIGFMFEGNVAAAPLVAGYKMPFTFDMGDAKVGVVAYTTDNLGIGYGFEQTSNGVTRGNRWAEHADWINAANFVGIGNGGNTGLAFYAKNDMGYINVSRYAPAFTAGGAGTAMKLSSTWVRVAATPNVADWSMIIGAGFASGTNDVAGAVATPFSTKARMFDAQAQGELGGKETSVYFAYVNAPSDAVNGNAYNNIQNATRGGWSNYGPAAAAVAATVTDKKAWNLGIDYTVIPHALSIGANYLSGTTGSAVAGTPEDVKVWSITAVYDLTQNVALHLNHSSASGSAYGATGTLAGTKLVGGRGNSLTTFMLEAAF